MTNAPARLLAEFVGTFALIFIGAGSIMTASELAGGGYALIGIAAAHGFVLVIFISALGHISGGHFNPAVSTGLLITGKIKPVEWGAYVVTQLVGGAVAALALTAIYSAATRDATGLGTPAIGDAYSAGQAVFVEAILTFFLVFAVMAVAVDSRGAFKMIAGIPIGFVVFVDILMGGPVTGAAMNPARWFGPALVSGNWSNAWVYIVGPIVGGAIAALVYEIVVLRSKHAAAE